MPLEPAKIGTDWMTADSELLLFVPSVVVAGENNVLINPVPPDMKWVKILDVESYRFDQRLLR